jgi:DNA-binding HxlR family transcriptional regulator
LHFKSNLLVECKQNKTLCCYQDMAPRKKNTAPETERRSPCPLACSLDIFGDRWTLLVIRDLVLGKSRFKDFTASPEGIPTNILSDRLARLQTHDIIAQVIPEDGSKHLAYQLTKKGEALRPILMAMRDWGLTWEKGTQAMLTASPTGSAPAKTSKQRKLPRSAT